MKYSYCELCKNQSQTSGSPRVCVHCGKLLAYWCDAEVIYGRTWKERVSVKATFTDRYIILYKISGGDKVAGATLGVLGSILSTSINTSKAATSHGFYGYEELEKIIYPYENEKLRKGHGIKFLFKDGTDLVMKVYWSTSTTDTLKRTFRKAGVPIVSDDGRHPSGEYCTNPLLTAETVNTRICASATFVKFGRGSFLAQPMPEPEAPKPVPESEAPKPVPVAPKVSQVQPPEPPTAPVQQARSTPSQYGTAQRANTRPAAPQAAAATVRFCPHCGNKGKSTHKFCPICGKDMYS